MRTSPHIPPFLAALLAAAGLFACSPKEKPRANAEPAVEPAPVPEPPRDWLSRGEPNASSELLGAGASVTPNDCRAALERTLGEPGLSGTPDLDASRPPVFLYAKAEPVVFTREPPVDATSSKEAVAYRAWIRRGSPWSTIRNLWPVFSARPDLGRSVLLRDGYLYSDVPEIAFALVDLVSAQQLFSDKRIWVQRGERLLHAERGKSGHYYYLDGEERGQRVRLVLFDRVGTGPVPEPLHRDFRSLRQRLGFDRVKVRHMTERTVVADLRYGSFWVPTLLDSKGARLELACEAPAAADRPKLDAFRDERQRFFGVIQPLREAMMASVVEGLPFDEPRTEYGQQDGRLRREWLRAYEAGKGSYEFQGDTYYVFNGAGRPLVPQVCVDFLFDTLERASGTWWTGLGETRRRDVGTLDFDFLGETRRRATGFIEFAQSRPDDFDVHVLAESERVPFKFGRQLADYLATEADHYRSGDVVVIRGYAPWDRRDRLMHFHSFFVYETDPVTGMPIMLAGNPGHPLLQTWQFEAFRTPDRSIWYRVRPHLDWLSRVITPTSDVPVPVAPMSVDRFEVRSSSD